MTWWIPWIFVIGLGVSVFGLVPAITLPASVTIILVFAVFTLLFGAAVARWLLDPWLISPRIVPYFARALGPHEGRTAGAFTRGRALYREMAALERLAGTLGVTPLSTFGFPDDHYEQDVRWHPATDGLRTVEALRHGLAAQPATAPDVVGDLETLASVLRAAADQGVPFSLVLRLLGKDSLQAVCAGEVRRGSFW